MTTWDCRANYVCQAKLAEVTSLDLPNVERIRTELKEEGHSGDFEHLANQVSEDKKSLLSMSSGECPGKSECPLAATCFAELAKEFPNAPAHIQQALSRERERAECT